MIRVCIVDDHPISRWGLQRAVEPEADIQVVGAYASRQDIAKGLTSAVPPDVVILDLFLADDLPCLGLVEEMAKRSRVVVVSASRRGADMEACQHAGARGFVHKGSDASLFVAAVRTVAGGGLAFPVTAEAPAAPADGLPALSPRERQVLAYIAGGYTHEQAARRLGVSGTRSTRTSSGCGSRWASATRHT